MHLPRVASTEGFTLLETVVVVGILLIIITLALDGMRSFRESSSLDQATDESLGLLREAREKTLAAEGGSAWGVHFTVGSVTLFRGGIYDTNDPSNNTVFVPSAVAASSINLTTTTASVVFDRLTGASPVTGTITFTGLRSGKTKRIQIFSSGLSAKQ
jgi:type IV fimbrial biogenesis protein FimU